MMAGNVNDQKIALVSLKFLQAGAPADRFLGGSMGSHRIQMLLLHKSRQFSKKVFYSLVASEGCTEVCDLRKC